MKTKTLFPRIKNLYILIIGIVLGASIFIGANASRINIMDGLSIPTSGQVILPTWGERVHNFIKMRKSDGTSLETPGNLSISGSIQIKGGFPGSGKFLKATDSAGNAIRAEIPNMSGGNGVSISGASINSSGFLIFILSNGNILTGGYVLGSPGIQGTTGANGATGIMGATGAQGLQGPIGYLQSGLYIGATPYWNGTQWVIDSQNIYNNGGNVGIGVSTVTADAKLQIGGSVKISNGITIEGLSNTGNFIVSADSSGNLKLISSTANTNNYCSSTNSLLRSDGNKNSNCSQAYATNVGLGIGTNNPLYSFHVQGNSYLNGPVSVNSLIDPSSIFRVSIDQFNTVKTIRIKKIVTIANPICQKSQCTVRNGTSFKIANMNNPACRNQPLLLSYNKSKNIQQFASVILSNIFGKAYASQTLQCTYVADNELCPVGWTRTPEGGGSNKCCPPEGGNVGGGSGGPQTCDYITVQNGNTYYENTCAKFEGEEDLSIGGDGTSSNSQITCINKPADHNNPLGCFGGRGESTSTAQICYAKNINKGNTTATFSDAGLTTTALYNNFDSYPERADCGIELNGGTEQTFNYLGTRNKPLICRTPATGLSNSISFYTYELLDNTGLNTKIPALTVNKIGGNVGIKKLNPLYALDVYGDINTDGFVKLSASATSCNKAADAGKMIYIDQCFCGCVGPYETPTGTQIKTGRVTMGGLDHCSNVCNKDLELKMVDCSPKITNTIWNSVSQLLSFKSTNNGLNRSSPNTGSAYSTTASTNSCKYMCAPGYVLSNGVCVPGTFNIHSISSHLFNQTALPIDATNRGIEYAGGSYAVESNGTVSNTTSAYNTAQSYTVQSHAGKSYLDNLSSSLNTVQSNISNLSTSLGTAFAQIFQGGSCNPNGSCSGTIPRGN